ncbi:hypothetical protein [Tuwongella immobilis]|nr:hypothetical protein [Tuwongella immobilis]
MMRFWLVCLALFGTLTGLRAADSPLAGNWKLRVPVQGQSLYFLMAFTESEGKWVGDYLDCSANLRVEPKVTELIIQDDQVRFTLTLGAAKVPFDGKIAKDRKKILGSGSLDGQSMLMEMTPSKLRDCKDSFALNQELFTQVEPGLEYFDVAFGLLSEMEAKKQAPEAVRAVVDRVASTAANYGSSWERRMAISMAEILTKQKSLIPVGLEQARRAERLLPASEAISTQIDFLETMLRIFRDAKQDADVKELETRIAKLEARDYLEYTRSLPFPVEPFAGRKGKSNRTLLVELFTNSEAQGAAAPTVALEGIRKAFKPTEVIVLQYHLHIPAPSTLVNKDAEERQQYYRGKLTAMPGLFLNGAPVRENGGPRSQAKAKYTTYREVFTEMLEQAPASQLKATLTRNGDEIKVTAEVSSDAAPKDKMSVRFALVEERVRSAGASGVRYHHNLVRTFLGGAAGKPITKAKEDVSVSYKLADLEPALNQYLDTFAKELAADGANYVRSERPMELKRLRIVAFLQNDTSQEIIQAIELPLEESESK